MCSNLVKLACILTAFNFFTNTIAAPRKLRFEEGKDEGIILNSFSFPVSGQLFLSDKVNDSVLINAQMQIPLLNRTLEQKRKNRVPPTPGESYTYFADSYICVTDRRLVTCDRLNSKPCFCFSNNNSETETEENNNKGADNPNTLIIVKAKLENETKCFKSYTSNETAEIIDYDFHDFEISTHSTVNMTETGYWTVAHFHDTFVKYIKGTGVLQFVHDSAVYYLWTANGETHLTCIELDGIRNIDRKLYCSHGGKNHTTAVAAAVKPSGDGDERTVAVVFRKISPDLGSIVCTFEITSSPKWNKEKEYISADLPGGQALYTFWSSDLHNKSHYLQNFCDDLRISPVTSISAKYQCTLRGVGTSLILDNVGNNFNAYIGTEDGFLEVLTISENGSTWKQVYELPLTKEAELRPRAELFVRRNYAFNKELGHIYVLTGDQMVKLKLNHPSLLLNCSKCVEKETPINARSTANTYNTEENEDHYLAKLGVPIGVSIMLAGLVLLTLSWCRFRKSRSRTYKVQKHGKGLMQNQNNIKGCLFNVNNKTLEIIKMGNLLVHNNALKLEEKVGQGHYGIVYKGHLLEPGTSKRVEVTVKTLHNTEHNWMSHLGIQGKHGARVSFMRSQKAGGFLDAQRVVKFLHEQLRVSGFRHENVLRIIGFCFDDTGIPMVIVPRAEHGNLRTYIQDKRNDDGCTSLMLINYGLQIAEGMDYLARKTFVHRELAARNCLLDENLTVKVADFNLSNDNYETGYKLSDKTKKLKLKWMAPETISKGILSTNSNVWSFGVVLWEILTRGMIPYAGVDNLDILDHLKKGVRLDPPPHCSDEMFHIMQLCWEYEPWNRPTFFHLMKDIGELYRLMNEEKQDRVVLCIDRVDDEKEELETML